MPKKWLLIVAKGVFLMTCKLGHKDYEGRKLSIVFTKLDSSSPIQTYMYEGGGFTVLSSGSTHLVFQFS